MSDMKLLNAMSQKMAWLEENQKVLAQNIANADTRGYRPQELKKPDFKEILRGSTSAVSLGTAGPATSVVKTNSKHIAATSASTSDPNYQEHKQKSTYEVARAGNAVVLEEQLLKMNENFTDHRLMTNLYQKNIDMLKEATKSN